MSDVPSCGDPMLLAVSRCLSLSVVGMDGTQSLSLSSLFLGHTLRQGRGSWSCICTGMALQPLGSPVAPGR